MIEDYIKLKAEIVNGKCPTCDEMTILVGLTPEYFRCISCGEDLEQKVNGVIKYIRLDKHMDLRPDGKD